jgi:hypothetical protein
MRYSRSALLCQNRAGRVHIPPILGLGNVRSSAEATSAFPPNTVIGRVRFREDDRFSLTLVCGVRRTPFRKSDESLSTEIDV